MKFDRRASHVSRSLSAVPASVDAGNRRRVVPESAAVATICLGSIRHRVFEWHFRRWRDFDRDCPTRSRWLICSGPLASVTLASAVERNELPEGVATGSGTRYVVFARQYSILPFDCQIDLLALEEIVTDVGPIDQGIDGETSPRELTAFRPLAAVWVPRALRGWIGRGSELGWAWASGSSASRWPRTCPPSWTSFSSSGPVISTSIVRPAVSPCFKETRLLGHGECAGKLARRP